MGDLLIYGAGGFTGRLLVEEARRRGLRPILAGRTAAKLRAIPSSSELSVRELPLTDPRRLERGLNGVSVVLNAAGPFSATAGPLVLACLRQGSHYLDITGEATVIESLARRDADARAAGVTVMPSIGFDVVPSDCLALHVARRAPATAALHIGLSGLALLSRGSARTIIDSLDKPTLARRNGALRGIPTSTARSFDFGRGPSRSVAMTWGDVATAFYSTGVRDVTTYFERTAPVLIHNTAVRLWGWAVPYTPWQSLLGVMTDWLPEGPDARTRDERQAVIVVEAEQAGRVVARARMRTPEAYTFTAQVGMAVAQRVLDGDQQPGFQTAARVFGADFVLGLPGVAREDLA
jgi:short subunit dehydrogenase-like uncharacterized protein